MMKPFGNTASERRTRNARSLAMFGVVNADVVPDLRYRVIHEGAKATVFTIGYERRDGEGLIGDLHDADVDVLVDVRERAMSRKPDFRGAALRAFCEQANIEYKQMPELGSTEHQRETLRETSDWARFRKAFRAHAIRSMQEPLQELAQLAKRRSIALMCYERLHEECHRSILSELLHENHGVKIVAIC